MNSLLDISKRTVSKIIKRLGLVCFSCGWDKAICDIHHIIHTKNGGTNDHTNLTYICPNCHRLAHKGLLTDFKTIEEVIGDSWKKHYTLVPLSEKGRKRIIETRNNIVISRNSKIEKLRNSNIDRARFGWIGEAAIILEMEPQSVVRHLRTYAPDLLVKSYVRNSSKKVILRSLG